jgi:hypothetical protein
MLLWWLSSRSKFFDFCYKNRVNFHFGCVLEEIYGDPYDKEFT